MITLLHLLSYVGGLAAFLFITLSLGASLPPSPPQHFAVFSSGHWPSHSLERRELTHPQLADCCGSPSLSRSTRAMQKSWACVRSM